MATLKFILQTKKDNSPIYARLSIRRGKIIYRKTGITINFKDWSIDKGFPKQTIPQNKNITTKLKQLEVKIHNQLNRTDISEIDGDWLQFQIDLFFGRTNEHKQSEYVIDNINYIIENAHILENSKGGIGLSNDRVRQYKNLKSLLQDFQKKNKKKYKIKELTKILFDEFKSWLSITRKYSDTYYTKKISDLKVVCNNARSRGVEVSFDFHGIKTPQAKTYSDDEEVVTLTEDEIEKIEKIILIDDELINARKWLIIGCYVGQRGNDLTQKINYESFKLYGSNLAIEITQQKGNKPVIIPVHPKVKAIYDESLPLPIGKQKLNEQLKEVCRLAEINTPTMGKVQEKNTTIKGENRRVKKVRPKWQYIGTHTLRRTFATLHYGKIPTPYIMSVTGHAKESTLLQYINQSESKHLDIFNQFYKEQSEEKKSNLRVLKKAINE